MCVEFSTVVLLPSTVRAYPVSTIYGIIHLIMKRLIAILVILVIVGVTAFSFGYLPFRLKEGHVAVVFSKTSGWEQDPVMPGQFAWRWEFLVPNNATVHLLPAEPRSLDVQSSALLPSAETYAQLLEGTPVLKHDIRVRLRYRPSAATLARVVPAGIAEDSLENWYDDMDSEVRTALLGFLADSVLSLVDTEDLLVPASTISDRVREALHHRFPDLDFLSVVVVTLDLPDPQLYRLGRETYRTIQVAREAALVDAVQAIASNQAAADQRTAILRQYGDVFSEYPILLEYLDITARTGRDPLNLDVLQGVQPTVQ